MANYWTVQLWNNAHPEHPESAFQKHPRQQICSWLTEDLGSKQSYADQELRKTIKIITESFLLKIYTEKH